jgi:peptide/nickel transport system substrate-binding protein
MKKLALVIIPAIMLLSACGTAAPAGPTATPTPAPTEVPTSIPPTATPEPKVLNVCLGQEPTSLYIYSANRSQAMWSVLEGIYDGPIDYVNYQYQSPILEKVPSLADGDASLAPVTVKQGMDMIDTDGNLRTLQKDVSYFPSGCSTGDCAQTYAGTGDVQMDQLSVTFKLKTGLTWSDGTPLTTADSVFSYKLASDPATPAGKDLVKKTFSYTASDDTTVMWKGLPGYKDQQYMTRFWIPLPEHIFSGKDAASIAADPLATNSPIGWGPYVIQTWAAGDHITLQKNPAYFRAAEGLPSLDIINFRFLTGTSQQSMEALLAGECDLVDESTLLDDQLATIKDLQQAGKLKAAISGSTVWEGLNYGIKPAVYDSAQAAYNKIRPDYFADARTRQAIAMCINRDKIVETVWAGMSSTPATFFGAENPAVYAGAATYPYNPDAGSALLDQIGWKDYDNNPDTPRVAVNVPNLYIGAPLTLKYYSTSSEARKQVAEMIKTDLAVCGVGLEITQLKPEELFAAGPTGVVFGRQFDLAQFSWSPSSVPGCRFFTTAQINSTASSWTGYNVSGYSNPEFDAACQMSAASLPGQADFVSKQEASQNLFANDLPVVPLYELPRIGVSRPDLCNYQMDPTSRSALWNIEQLNYGATCQ